MLPMRTIQLQKATKPGRWVSPTRRHIHASRGLQTNPFFALASLSNARETQHLTKISRLPRVEHSPSLKLIQSSEVDPFDPLQPNDPSPRSARIDLDVGNHTEGRGKIDNSTILISEPADVTGAVSESDALSVGRAILAEKDSIIQRLEQSFVEERERGVKREQSYALARVRNRDTIDGLKNDVAFAQNIAWMLFAIVGVVGLVWGRTLLVEDEIPDHSHEQYQQHQQRQRDAVASVLRDHDASNVALIPTPVVEESSTIEPAEPFGLKSLFWKRSEFPEQKKVPERLR